MKKGKSAVANTLLNEDNFILATHVNPDGDALGSVAALHMALKALGKKSTCYIHDPVPEFFKFLPGSSSFSAKVPPRKGRTLVLLDCNEPKRAKIPDTGYKLTVVVDHHETESGFGDITWIEPHAAATGLMVHELIRRLKVPLTRQMAMNLYAAISVDTGAFRYNNTDTRVLKAAADLVKAGAEPGRISEGMYESWSVGRMKLLALTLATLQINGPIATIVVTHQMMKQTGTDQSDTENFSNYPRMLQGITVGAMLRETEPGLFKISMRSKGTVNVAKVASKFSGGGHRNAAGCAIRGSVEAARSTLLKELKKIV